MMDDELRATLLSLARELESLVVSLDRIGSTYGNEREKLESTLTSYMIDADAFGRLARARRTLYAILTEGDEGFEADERLARELGEVDYWTPDESDKHLSE